MELRQPRLRLRKAHERYEEFGRLWNGFIEGEDPYTASLAIDEEGEGSIYIEVDPAIPREQLALCFGEMLYHLRAALDSLVYEIAIIDSGQDPPPDAEKLEFPIRSSQASFDQAARKIGPLSDQHRRMVRSIQPYDAGERSDGQRAVAAALDELNDLARKDRHRGVRVITSWVANKRPKVSLPPGCDLLWLNPTPPAPLDPEGEQKVADFKIANWRGDPDAIADVTCTIDVFVEGIATPASDADTLDARARMMLAAVSELIGKFEQTLA